MKSIPPENYLVSPFLTHKTQIYEYTYLSASNVPQVTIDLAVQHLSPEAWQFVPGNESINPSGIYEGTLYASIQNLFYHSGSVYSLGNLFNANGTQFYVISLAQPSYGETIRKGSFTLTSPNYSTGSLTDDGNGHITGANTSSIVGNIFYGLGIVVLRQVTGSFSSSVVSDLGMFLDTGSQVQVQFDATQTIYEHQVICTMEVGEFNYSTNPSISSPSSSVSGSDKIYDAFASGTLTPYITTVGAYTNRGELVAIAKFPRPVKRVPESQQTVIIRWDS